ncbi:MAG: DUF493 domain-containing protein [Algoriphagus aquaeductus]|jgi:putative lipoic acid-binding regulatory protein|uniref:DUF493 domain-containing protein n=1 Tax=Algoriphagus TaxID=246875 RepID=UPI002586F0D3|nr:DUF493 domain-containing protein [Algoriphagus sp.]
MKSKFDKQAFKEKLESVGQFPMLYMFKFIVPAGKEQEIEALFPSHEVSLKPSSGGKYVSTTVQMMAVSADLVIEVYEKAAQIEGVISL